MESALKQVKLYVKREKDNFNNIKDAELPINLTRKNYIMVGKVDLIKNSSGGFEILDFKTEKKPDISSEQEKIDRVRMQLEVYAHLIEKKYRCKNIWYESLLYK